MDGWASSQSSKASSTAASQTFAATAPRADNHHWDQLTFEEIDAAFVTELEAEYRRLCLLGGMEHPTKEELKFVALTVQVNGEYTFRTPNPWNLDDPTGP